MMPGSTAPRPAWSLSVSFLSFQVCGLLLLGLIAQAGPDDALTLAGKSAAQFLDEDRQKFLSTLSEACADSNRLNPSPQTQPQAQEVLPL